MPAHGPIGLPLQLALAPGDRQFGQCPILVPENDRVGIELALQDRHLQHAARLGRDGQEGAVGLLALVAQRGQHHRHHFVVVFEDVDQPLVEAPADVPVGRALELVIEAEPVEESAQHGVVVVAEALELAEGIGNAGQRHAQILAQHLRVRHVVRHLAQSVHVVGKGEEAGRQIGHAPEGLAHHGGAHHLAERADMGQARGAISGFEQHIALGRRCVLESRDQLARFLEGPSPRRQSISSFLVHRLIPQKEPPDPMGHRAWRQRVAVRHSRRSPA